MIEEESVRSFGGGDETELRKVESKLALDGELEDKYLLVEKLGRVGNIKGELTLNYGILFGIYLFRYR